MNEQKGKKKMGRPMKKAKDRLSKIVTLRMSPSEHEQLMKDVKSTGLSISLYLQECWKKARQ